MYQAPTTPQSIGAVLDSGFELFRASFTQVVPFAVATSVVTLPASVGASFLEGVDITFSVGLGLFLVVLLMICLILVLTGATIARADGVARGAPLSLTEALGIGGQRAPAMLGAGLLTALLVLLGFILLVIPAFVVAVWFFFAAYAVVIDRLGPVDGMTYSRDIVRGHWWRTAGVLTIIGVVLTVIYAIFGFFVGMAMISNPETLVTGQAPWYIEFLLGPLMSALVTPLGYSLFLAAYYDLKLRYEGIDLAARIATLA